MNRYYIHICSLLMGIALVIPSGVSAQESESQPEITASEENAAAAGNEGIALKEGSSVSLSAAQADSLYIQGDYLAAVSVYEAIISNVGVSASLYMNLGNAYYQLDEIAKAILCYERAYLLDPSDDDIRFNLELARTKTVDKVSAQNRFFLAVFMEKLTGMLNISQWTVLVILFFVLAAVMGSVFVLSRKLALKKTSFYTGVCLLILSVLCMLAASGQKRRMENRNTAIIIEPSVTVKSTPSKSGTDLFIIHEGHKVFIQDASMKEWVQIGIEDGNSGWIQFKSIEVI